MGLNFLGFVDLHLACFHMVYIHLNDYTAEDICQPLKFRALLSTVNHMQLHPIKSEEGIFLHR